MRLFISYSRDDKNFVYELARKLNEEAQHDVWIDKRLKGAELWWDTIISSIENCDCFVYILTPRSAGSIYCQTELKYALALNKPVLPLLLKACEIPDSLRAVQYIDISDLSLLETLFSSTKALHRVEIALLSDPDHGKAVGPKPARPPVPKAKPGNPADIYETFKSAEEAFENGSFQLAKDLFRNVVTADPGGYGKVARERIKNLEKQIEIEAAYQKVVKFVRDGLIDAGQIAWHKYLADYGPDYDPEKMAERFTKPQENESETTTIPVAETFSHQPVAIKPTKSKTKRVIHEIITEFDDHQITPPKPQPVVVPKDKGRGFQTQSIPQDYVLGKMQHIPAGNFVFGRNHSLFLEDFYIDVYPVTNRDFLQYIQATKARGKWHKKLTMDEYAIHPVTHITYEQALGYCDWVGKRLPTAQEWEKAARGFKGNRYPWGNRFVRTNCNNVLLKPKETTAVNSFPGGGSPFGVYDMVGNVWEWTSETIKARGIGRKNNRIIKGGSFKSNEGSLANYEYSSSPAGKARDDIGFRCVWSK